MSSRIASVRRLIAVACFVGFSSASVALAQNNPKVAAEALFLAGQQQLEQKQYAEACKSFSESQRLDPSVGTLLNLGLCNENQGKLASAWAAFKEAAQLASTRQDRQREDAARGFAAKLEPRLSHLTVSAKNAVPGLIVRRDGLEVGGLGLALAIDPGEHEIEALAPGRKSWKTKVTIGAEADRQSVEIPPLERGEGEVVAPGGGASKSDGTPLVIAGFVVGGVGVAGLALGTAFGVIASGTVADAEDDPALCPGRVCSEAGRLEIDSAETQATISTVGLVVGGVALAGGAVLVAIGFSSGDATERAPATAFYATPELTIFPYVGDVAALRGAPAAPLDGAVLGLSGVFQ